MFTSDVSHWDHHARQWQWLDSPLRPAPVDIREYLRLLGRYRPATDQETLKVLLLGVTPEIATMEWPPGTELLETVRPSYELGERCPIVALRRRNVS